MKSIGRGGIAWCALVAATQFAPGPAAGFELFGIHLWGERESQGDELVDIIDPLPYTVDFQVTGDDNGLQRQLEEASSLWSDRETPAAGRAGLISKARGDYRRLLSALYAEGYYGPAISIRAAGAEVADLTLAANLPAEVPMEVVVEPGPRFRFGATEIVNRPSFPLDDGADTVEPPASVGFVTGEPAIAEAISGASALAVERWRQLARAKAREADRQIVADHPSTELDVRITLDPGPAVRYGRVRAVGSKRTDAEFIAYMADLPEGAPYDPDDIAEAQDRLSALRLFRLMRFEEGEVGPDGLMPITIRLEDRRPRTIGFGGTYSTIDGLGLSAFWVHRNLFGRAERLRFDASIERLLTSTDPRDYNYNLGVSFTKPGVLSPDTSLILSAVARQLDFEDYRETSITGRAGFSRQFGRRLKGDLFAEVSRARYEDDFGTRNFTTFGLAGRGEYDRRDNELDPTTGYYLAADANPFYESNFGNFVIRGILEGRKYFGLGEERRIVLAGRGKIGSYYGAGVAESPPGLLFFAGGGGSIRGYEYRSIGVEVENDGETITAGGRGLVELSGEVRTRIGESWGAVGFVDGGYVTADPDFMSDGDLRVGVGVGVRYYTAIGPLRADLAFPVNRRPQDNFVALYIGIGQAF